MPQLDQVTFLPQVFWLVVLFLLFYIVSSEYYLPRISAGLKLRAKYFSHVGKGLNDKLSSDNLSLTNNLDKTLSPSVTYAVDFIGSVSKEANSWISASLGQVYASQWKSINHDYLSRVVRVVGMSSLISQFLKVK
uniref:H(+)-transporting two-sector ATPase n=1 Tax=Ophirina amphinema TaxID=2108040 RepID=A0A348AYU7_9EUKA|nr:ATP synthase F0 subunit 8 [Ophirina amphinema]